MRLPVFLVLSWILGTCSLGLGQNLLLQVSAMPTDSLESFSHQVLQVQPGERQPPSAGIQPSSAFLPSYALQNPSGYSFLCLKELEIENKLPLGVWIKLENPAYLRPQLGNQASFRLKLLRF